MAAIIWLDKSFCQKCEVDLSNGSCSPGICHGSSQCTNKNSAIVCKNCSFEAWSTEMCQLKTRNFDRGTYLTFPSLRQRHRLSISIKFATQERHALLLYNGRYNDEHDFISLEIINAQLLFSFSLGGQVSQVPTFVAGGVSDGQWHTAEVNYFNRSAVLSVDDCDVGISLKYGKHLRNYLCANITTQQLEKRIRKNPTFIPLEQGVQPAALYWRSQVESIAELSSDHNPLLISFDTNIRFAFPKRNVRTDWEVFQELLSPAHYTFQPITARTGEDVETQVADLTDRILHDHALASKPIRNENTFYVNNEIRSLMKERNRARKVWQFSRNPNDKRVLNNIQNRLHRKIVAFQNKTWEDELHALVPEDGSLWEKSKELRSMKTPVFALNGRAGIAHTDSDKAEVLACSLETKFQENNITNPQGRS
ncbi:cadherin EGF LAG seven-pass G-type receptor 2 [Trichonephila inaurata madagascariensis]|uniref:Cadherin EGF LAG seven-pass G-type receptor 2 n=1 Tax=Trichonephila inaurata madagascariensis TaxID=2747483 RepID=A0A8X7CS03_9ARAC|nr:cadherin EGF LAG seven-pass G-type receptor 2 [Trichonephila inaurata madagascariensis]